MKDVSADGGPASPLERLERLAWGLHNRQAARVSGVITEVSVSHYRVAGLSRFLRLGECVSVNIGECVQIGEVVKIDDASATLKPFDARCEAAIGAGLSHRRPLAAGQSTEISRDKREKA